MKYLLDCSILFQPFTMRQLNFSCAKYLIVVEVSSRYQFLYLCDLWQDYSKQSANNVKHRLDLPERTDGLQNRLNLLIRFNKICCCADDTNRRDFVDIVDQGKKQKQIPYPCYLSAFEQPRATKLCCAFICRVIVCFHWYFDIIADL